MGDQTSSIKVIHGRLDETPLGEIILRGVIDPGSLERLLVDRYQREELAPTKIARLMEGHRKSGVPDIELGMRGERYTTRRGAEDVFYLQDPVYIVDGYQRVTAAKRLLALNNSAVPHQGAMIHFGTTYAWERERFDILNLHRTKLSPNVVLRNLADDYAVADMLTKLTRDPKFVLCDRVTWSQNQRKGDLITGSVYFRTVGMLHSHIGPGRGAGVIGLVQGMQKIMDATGRSALRENVKTFYEVIDSAWGVRQVAYRQVIHLKLAFMLALARVFSEHTNFWEGDRLVVPPHIIKKLGRYQTNDPTVIQLAGGNSQGSNLLFRLLIDHLDYGTRTRKLTPRVYLGTGDMADDEVDE